MKKWISLVSVLILSACQVVETDFISDEEGLESIDIENETSPQIDEIERLLTIIELETGLDHLASASSLFAELSVLVAGYELTANQQARMNTLAELLADTLATQEDSTDNERLFTGSDAAAKVMNMIGFTPEGYHFVYHEIPSAVGLDGLGYYVFLVPIEPVGDEVAIRETFFVTDRGEILVLD